MAGAGWRRQLAGLAGRPGSGAGGFDGVGGRRLIVAHEYAIELAHTIVDTLDEKKGDDILLLDLSEVCTFTELFVICTGASERTLKALSGEVQRRVKAKHKSKPLQVEGDPSSGWILLDYGEVILHLFSAALREYYALEELWGEGKVLLRIA